MQGDESEGYEEMTMVLELDGILDAEGVRHAVRTGQIAIRKGQTASPIVQVGPSIYTGEWVQALGTDMIFRKLSAADQSTLECHGSNEKSQEFEEEHRLCDRNVSLKLVAVQDTRLSSNKAIITRYSDSDASNFRQDITNKLS